MKPKVYKYANGGKVAAKGPKRSTRDTVASPKPASAADAMMNQRARQMKAMGLKDGGQVKKPALPGPGTRVVKPTQLPAPQAGPKPKKIGR